LPTVEAVTVEWEECLLSGEGPPTEDGAFSHSMHAAGGTIEPLLPCSNPGCRGGGFEILDVIESMVTGRREAKAGLLVCIGWERTKDRRTEQSPCTRAISYRVRLTYRKKDGLRRESKG
jgi:hypothetical protein